MPTIVARYGYIEPQDAPEAWAASGSIDTPGDLLRWLPQGPRVELMADMPRR
jgi:hypothetical protein